MQKKVFDAKSAEMNDFYLYYTKPDGRSTFAVATVDVSSPYIKNHKRAKNLKPYNPSTHARVWDWKSDRFLEIPLSKVRKLVPLATVLKNEHRYNRFN